MSWKAIKTVYSESTGDKYYIKQSTTTKEYTCTCKGFIFNQEDPKTCKHVRAVITENKGKKSKPIIKYWVVSRPNGDLARNDLFTEEITAKWWANHFSNHSFYPYSDYKIERVTLKRGK